MMAENRQQAEALVRETLRDRFGLKDGYGMTHSIKAILDMAAPEDLESQDSLERFIRHQVPMVNKFAPQKQAGTQATFETSHSVPHEKPLIGLVIIYGMLAAIAVAVYGAWPVLSRTAESLVLSSETLQVALIIAITITVSCRILYNRAVDDGRIRKWSAPTKWPRLQAFNSFVVATLAVWIAIGPGLGKIGAHVFGTPHTQVVSAHEYVTSKPNWAGCVTIEGTTMFNNRYCEDDAEIPAGTYAASGKKWAMGFLINDLSAANDAEISKAYGER